MKVNSALVIVAWIFAVSILVTVSIWSVYPVSSVPATRKSICDRHTYAVKTTESGYLIRYVVVTCDLDR